jgi:hypothetical protein
MLPASSAATPAAPDATLHSTRTRLKNDVVRPLKLFDGLIRYDPGKRAFATEPVSHHDTLSVPAWKEAMDTEVRALCHN